MHLQIRRGQIPKFENFAPGADLGILGEETYKKYFGGQTQCPNGIVGIVPKEICGWMRDLYLVGDDYGNGYVANSLGWVFLWDGWC